MLELGDGVLTGVGGENGFPAVDANHGDDVDVGMFLEGLHGVGDVGFVVDGEELFGDFLTHAHAATAGDDQCDVHVKTSRNFDAFTSIIDGLSGFVNTRTEARDRGILKGLRP